MAVQRSLGRYGIWSWALRTGDPARDPGVIEAAQELEQLGYQAVWIGGSSDVSHATGIIEATSALTVATGILSIWQHDAAGVAARYHALESAHPGRFLLGLGASHAKLAADYRRPYSAMVSYLDALDAAPTPVPADRRVLAALGPRMLELSRDRAGGAHPYLVTPEHTERARAILGPDALLAPEVKVVLETDPDRARAIARDHLAMYMELPNYTNNLLRLGFTDLTATDISATALEKMRERLGHRGDELQWIVGDITTVALPARRYDLWHDRAIFHFLAEREHRQHYVAQVKHALRPNVFVILSTFGPDGPTRCSGLDVCRYDSATLFAEFGSSFELLDSNLHEHITPAGKPQQFQQVWMRLREDTGPAVL